MSILLMVLALAQIQIQPQCYSRPDPDGCNIDKVCRDEFGREAVQSVTAMFCTKPGADYFIQKPVAPVEHIIEIRTKREDNGPAYDIQGADLSTLHFHQCVYDDSQTIEVNTDDKIIHCMHVTKTLWIDGQRIGTIREVEEK